MTSQEITLLNRADEQAYQCNEHPIIIGLHGRMVHLPRYESEDSGSKGEDSADYERGNQ